MKKLLLTAALLVQSAVVFSQEEQAIQQWQSAHPSTQLISVSLYTSLSDGEKALIGTDYVLFTEKLTIKQLEASAPSLKNTGVKAPSVLSMDEAQVIKDWLGAHPEVWIVEQSYFQQANEEERLELETAHAMILEGEVVTLNDIINYQ